MQIMTAQRTSQVSALASIALVEKDTFGIEIYFGTNSMRSPRVVFEKDIFTKQLSLKKVITDLRHNYIYSHSTLRDLRDQQLEMVLAAMFAVGVDRLPVGRDFLVLDMAPEVVVIERTVYVERPQTVIRETVVRERTIVVERPARPERPVREHQPTSEEALAGALGGLIGFGLGLLVNRK